MRYVKALIFNFLVVFFANYILPGVDVVNQTKLPHIGGDMIFAAGLGLLNFLIVPLLGAFDGTLSIIRLSMISFIVNFAAYALLKLLPLGVFVTNIEGYVLAAAVVSVGSILLGASEIRHRKKGMHMAHPHDHSHHVE